MSCKTALLNILISQNEKQVRGFTNGKFVSIILFPSLYILIAGTTTQRKHNRCTKVINDHWSHDQFYLLWNLFDHFGHPSKHCHKRTRLTFVMISTAQKRQKLRSYWLIRFMFVNGQNCGSVNVN